jgi:single-stranded DNA-binding protein
MYEVWSERMNSLILNAIVVGDPKLSVTKADATKALFQISTDGRDMPLHFQCVCFGAPAQVAAGMYDGDEILISGRLVANTVTRGITLVVHSMEILSSNQPEGETERQTT